MSGDEELERLVQAAHGAARAELAPEHLAERVLDHIAYRRRLETPPAGQPNRRPWQPLVFAAAGSIAAAAAIGAFAHASFGAAPGIAAERPAGTSVSRTSTTTPAVHLPPPDPCRERTVATGSRALLDDFEDGDDALAPFERRAGFWRWARETDAPGTAPALIPVPRGDATARNRLALHVKGGQLNDWGATVEVDFLPRCYDATRYAGVGFQARGPGRIYLALREVGVIPVAEGGTCERDCHNPHVVKVDLAPEWRSYEFRWAELRQRGIGKAVLDPSRLNSIAFLIRPEDTPYDVWVDEVRFLPNAR